MSRMDAASRTCDRTQESSLLNAQACASLWGIETTWGIALKYL